MPNTRSKPRWIRWESRCLRAAVQQNIQLKIIALALEKSVGSVNKKIGAMGLRRQSLLKNSLPSLSLPRRVKTPQDVSEMLTIVMRHAPKSRAQKTKTFLETLPWAHSSPFSSPQEERTNRRTKEKLPYVCGVALNATPLHLEYGFIPGTKKSNGTPLYVSLNYVEKWAISRGFHKLQDVLRERGYLFWKEGQYFSKAQILVHINRVRLNHKLPLLHLQGQENRAQHLE